MRYVDALKIWNQTQNNDKWCFVEKGSVGHAQVLEIMKQGKPLKTPPETGLKKRIIKVKKKKSKKQIGGFAEGFRGDFKSNYPWYDPRFAEDLKNYEKQQGNGMIMPGNGLILPGRQKQRGGGDFPLEFAVEFAQDPLKYVNKLGSFMDATSGTKQMAEQIERETGAKRLFKWPWE